MKKTLVLILITLICAFCAGAQSIVTNGDFMLESGGLPIGWSQGGLDMESAEFSLENGILKIVSEAETLTYVTQDVYTEAEQSYKFSAEIKTENYGCAYLGFLDKAAYSESATSDEFTEISMYFITSESVVPIMLMLGNYETGASGEAYFKNVSVEPVDKVPPGSVYFRYVNEISGTENINPGFDMRWIWLILITAAVIILSVYYLFRKDR